METMKLQKKVTASAMLDPKIVMPATLAGGHDNRYARWIQLLVTTMPTRS